MKRATPLVALVAFAVLALAYSRTDAEPTLSELRKVEAFTQVEVAGTLAVEVRVGAPRRVEVRGDAELVRQVETTVRGGVLVLATPRGFGKGRKRSEIRVIVTTPDLTRASISGAATLEVRGIAAKSFVASISGTGALALAGRAEQVHLAVSGTAEIDAQRLVAAIVELAVPGTAKATVHATRSLDAAVSGTAIVAVHGKPASVKRHVDGVALIDVE